MQLICVTLIVQPKATLLVNLVVLHNNLVKLDSLKSGQIDAMGHCFNFDYLACLWRSSMRSTNNLSTMNKVVLSLLQDWTTKKSRKTSLASIISKFLF